VYAGSWWPGILAAAWIAARRAGDGDGNNIVELSLDSIGAILTLAFFAVIALLMAHVMWVAVTTSLVAGPIWSARLAIVLVTLFVAGLAALLASGSAESPGPLLFGATFASPALGARLVTDHASADPDRPRSA
jgi:hypothetical protein